MMVQLESVAYLTLICNLLSHPETFMSIFLDYLIFNYNYPLQIEVSQ